MKKVFNAILLLVILIIGIAYWVILKNGTEKFEIINNDVSINNVKSILNIENESDENIIEIPLGYNDGKIYVLKYDYKSENGLYEKDIFTLNDDGTLEKTGIQLPDDFITSNIYLYGEKVFCKNRCFNWLTGEDITLFYDDDSSNMICQSVSGNNKYFLFIKNQEEKQYILYDMENKKYYRFKDNGNEIGKIFYDSGSDNFYCLSNDNVIKKVNLENNDFTLEDYDQLRLMDKIEDNKVLNYIFCNNGIVYFGQGFEYGLENLKNELNSEFDIDSYSISDKESEKMNSISICEYDRYYSDCVIMKKKDYESSGRLYFSKLKNNGPDIIMEISKNYGNDSIVTVHMNESGNLLIKETYDDKENKKIKNKYTVYDLKEYFTDNEYVLNDDGTWTGKEDSNVTLKYTFKNIDDSQQEKNEDNKLFDPQPQINENDNKESSNEKSEKNDIFVQSNDNKNNNEENDFRENDPSWKQEWYYYDENNNKVSGWVKSGDGWYYFDNDGVMQKDAIVIEHGDEFKLDSDGKLIDSSSNNTKYLENQNKANKKGNNKYDNDDKSIDKYKDENKNVSTERDDKEEINDKEEVNDN